MATVPKWGSGVYTRQRGHSRGPVVVLRSCTSHCFFLRGTNSLKTFCFWHGARAKVGLFPCSSQVMAKVFVQSFMFCIPALHHLSPHGESVRRIKNQEDVECEKRCGDWVESRG